MHRKRQLEQYIITAILISFLWPFAGFQFAAHAQSKKTFEVSGIIIPEDNRTGAGLIEITKNQREKSEIEIPKSGKFKLALEFQNEYQIIFKYPEHFQKIIVVSTDLPEDVFKNNSNFPPFVLTINLLKVFEGLDKSFTIKTSEKIFYDKAIDNFKRDVYITDPQFFKQVEIAKAQAQKVLKESQSISKEDAQDLARKQANFDQLLSDADMSYQKGEFQIALQKYLEAKSLFPLKAYANDRIAELQDLVKAMEINEKQRIELEQKYKDAIARANQLFEKQSFKEARPVYQEALKYKKSDEFANKQIVEIDKMLALLEKLKEYDALIVQADLLFKQSKLDQAQSLYAQASLLVPDKDYPNKQMNTIREEKEKIALLEKKEAEFKLSISVGDQLATGKDYSKALESYQKALQLNPEDPTILNKIAETEKLIAKSETDQKYNEAIRLADLAFAGKDLSIAKQNYQQATVLKSAETYPKTKLQEIEILEKNEAKFNELMAEAEKLILAKEYTESLDLLQDALKIKPKDASIIKRMEEVQKLKDIQQKEKGYDLALKHGDELRTLKQFDNALKSYNEALSFKAGDKVVLSRIAETRKLQTDSEKELQYLSVIEKADLSFDQKNYIEAKAGYNQSLLLKPGENHPTSRIKEIDKIFETEKQMAMLDANYKNLLAKADEAFSKLNYQDARKSYVEAVQIKPAESYPADQIRKIDELLAEKEKTLQIENEFKSLLASGDDAVKQKQYESARIHFNNALTLIPNSQEAINKIKTLDELLIKLAEDQKREEAMKNDQLYASVFAEGEKQLKSKEYILAKQSFVKALEIKPNETLPKTRIDEIDQLLATFAQNEARIKEATNAYQLAISTGDQAFNANNYDEAIKQFEIALQNKANDSYATRQITAANKRKNDFLAEQSRLKKLEEQYQTNIASADKDFGNKNYVSAKGNYQKALSIKPEDNYSKEQINTVDRLLNEIKANDEINRQYIESMKAAELLYTQNKITEARDTYQKAHDLKPLEPEPIAKIAEIHALLEQNLALAKQAELKKQQIEAEEKAAKEKYDQFITAADLASNEKRYTEAKIRYQEASKLNPNEKYPKLQIDKLNNLIVQAEKAAILTKQQASKDSVVAVLDLQYNGLIASALAFEQSGKFQSAIQEYKEAMKLKPGEKVKLQKSVDQLNNQMDAMEAAEKLYQLSIFKADALSGALKYDDAIKEFRNAANIKPEESYPKKRIDEIERILSDLTGKYNQAIGIADSAFNKADWITAKANYSEALVIKPDEIYPGKRLKEVNSKMAEAEITAKRLEAENKAYNDVIEKAEKAMAFKQLTEARTQFVYAQKMKPNESLPTQRIAEIDSMVAKQKEEQLERVKNAPEEKYRQAISLADEAFRGKDYPKANTKYKEAQLAKPDESYPAKQLALIQQLQNEPKVPEPALIKDEGKNTPYVSRTYNPTETPEAIAARAKSYQPIDNYKIAIDKADELFNIEDYPGARFFYFKALEISPSEVYPKNQIEMIRKLLDSRLSVLDRTGYDEAIQLADEAFTVKKYPVAKFYYYKALDIKSWEQYPKDRIQEIQVLTNSLLSEKIEKEYRDHISKADEAYFSKEIAIARFYYNRAISLKPDEKYPKIKLKDIEKLIEQDQRDQINIEYSNLIDLADAAFQQANYSIARFNYNKALGLKPNEKYPKEQLKLIREALEKPKMPSDGIKN
jgi:tetratricopeptide (TPR) repeat protein